MSSKETLEGLKISEKLRLKLYSGIHHILTYKNLPATFACVLTVFHYLQIIFLTYNNNDEFINESFLKDANNIMEAVLVFPTIRKNPNKDLYLALFIISLIILTFLFGSLLFFIQTKELKSNTVLQTFARVTGFTFEISKKLLYLPIMGILMLSFDCDVLQFEQCFGVGQIILVIVATIFMILYTIFKYVLEAYFFTFSFKSKDSFARAPSTISMLGLIYELVSIILVVFFFDEEYNLMYGIYQILFGAIFLNNFITKIPFFNDFVLKAHVLSTAAFLWINIAIAVTNVSNLEMLESNILSVIIVGIVFFLVVIANTRSIFIKTLLTKATEEIRSDIHIDAQARLLFNLAKMAQRRTQSELFLASLMRIHANKCNKPACPCKNRRELYDPKKSKYSNHRALIHKDFIFIKHFILNIIKNGTSRFLDSKLLMLDMIYFLFESLKNYPQAYVQLIHFKRREAQSISSVIQFIIFRLEFDMQEYLTQRNQESGSTRLELENVMKYDQQINKLKENITQVTTNFIDIWEIVDSQLPDLQILSRAFNKNLEQIKATNNLYEEIAKLNNHSLELKIIMELYCGYITFDELYFSKIQEDIKLKSSMNIVESENLILNSVHDNWDIFDENSCTIEISSNYDKMGQIVDFSTNAPFIFGYDTADLKLQNVNALLPRIMGKFHTQVLKNYFDTGHQTIIGHTRRVFGLHKDGHVFSCLIIIKIIPGLGNFRIIGLIHKINDHNYILTDYKGEVDSVGEEAARLFGIPPHLITKVKINLQLISPKLTSLYKNFYRTERHKHEDASEVSIPIKFLLSIPGSLERYIQKFNEDTQEINWDIIEKYESRHHIDSAKITRDMEKDVLTYKEAYGRKILQTIQIYGKRKIEKVIKIKGSVRILRLFRQSLTLYAIKITSSSVKDASYLTPKRMIKQQKYLKTFEEYLQAINKKIQDTIENPIEEENIEIVNNTPMTQDKDPEIELDARAKNRMKKLLPLFEKKTTTEKVQSMFHKKSFDRGGTFLEEEKQGLLSNNEAKITKFSDLIKALLKQKKDKNQFENQHQRKKGEESRSPPVTNSLTNIQDDTQKPKLKTLIEINADKLTHLIAKPETRINEALREKLRALARAARERVLRKQKLGISLQFRNSSKTIKESNKEKELALVESSSDESEDMLIKKNKEAASVLNSLETEGKYKNQDFKSKLRAKQVKGVNVHVEAQSTSSISANLTSAKLAKYLREALNNQKTPLSLQLSYLFLYVLILALIAATIGLEVKVRSDSKNLVTRLSESLLPEKHGYLLLMTFDSYLSFKLSADGILDNTTIYDSAWHTKSVDIIQSYHQEIKDTLFIDTTEATTLDFLHDVHEYSMRFPTNSNFALTFDKFAKLVMNAVESTINLDRSAMNNPDNEFLYLLNNNVDSLIDFIDIQISKILSNIRQSFSNVKTIILAIWITNLIVMIAGFLLVFPVIFKAKLAIEQILVVFTKISKADSEFYLQHYKIVRIKWNALSNDLLNLHKDIIESLKLENKDKKARQGYNISRSKLYKGLKSQNYTFLLFSLVFLLVVLTIISVRSLTHIFTCNKLESQGEFFGLLSRFDYEFAKVYIKYRMLVSDAIQQSSYNEDEITEYRNILSNFDDLPSLMGNALNPLKVSLTDKSQNLINEFFFTNACRNFLQDPADIPECEALIKSLLLRGYQPFLEDTKSYIRLRYNYITSDIKSMVAASLVSTSTDLINDPFLKEARMALIYSKEGFDILLSNIEKDINDRSQKQLNQNIITITFYFVLLLLFLAIFWRRQYHQLKNEVFKTNFYFVLLPFNLLKDNQHIRTYLQRDLNVKSLSVVF